VAVAEGELEVAALVGHAVTRAVDLHALLVALGDTEDHVVDERAGQAVQGTGLALVVGALDLEAGVTLLDGDGLGHDVRELALGALHRDGAPVDGDVDTARDGDRESSDSRHVEYPLPDVGEDFPAHTLGSRLPVHKEARRNKNNGHAQTTKTLGRLVDLA
jgi:hypothetical protein